MTDIAIAACPNPQKLGRFVTQQFAEAVARAQSIRASQPIYTYPCDCGFWHLTSKKQRKHRPSRRPLMTMNNTTLTHPTTDTGAEVVWSSEHVEPIEELLRRAENGSGRVRTLAADIRRRVTGLADVIETDERVAAWESELEEVNARKAELEEMLAAAVASDTPPVITVVADVLADDEAEDAHQAPLDLHRLVTRFAFDGRVRGWARTQGYQVAKQGRIATSVVRMWIAAHPDVAGADD